MLTPVSSAMAHQLNPDVHSFGGRRAQIESQTVVSGKTFLAG
jgi:hypothetical protein